MRYFLMLFFLFFQVCFAFGETKEAFAESNLSVQSDYVPSEFGIFTGTKGLGKVQETGFGRFRLISCSGGIPENNVPFFMIEGKLFDGWRLQKPVIPKSDGNEILKEEILYPINSLAEKSFTGYDKEVYFPLVYHLKEGTKEFSINKKFPVKSCFHDSCKEDILDLSLSIKDDTKYPTDICSKMMRRFQMAIKKPKAEELMVRLSIVDDNHLQILATFNDDVSYFNIQTNDLGNFDIVKKEFKGKKASILIKTNVEKIPETFVITVISSLGIFETDVKLLKDNYVFLGENLVFFSVFLAGILLFFLSPLLYLFLSLPDEKQTLLTQSNKIIKYFASLFFVLGALFFFKPDLVNLFEIRGIWAFVIALLLCYLLYRPKFDLKVGVLLFLLMPKPYFIDSINSLPAMDWRILLVFSFWMVLTLLPFMMFKKIPILFSEIKKLKQYPILIRLPQGILLFWLLLTLLGNVVPSYDHKNSFQTLKNEKQTIYVSVENGLCFSCMLNRWMLSYYLNNLTEFDKEKVHILTFKSNDSIAQTFIKENKLINKTQMLLFGPKQPFPEKIEGFVPVEEWYHLLKKVMPEKKKELPELFKKGGY